MPPMLCVDGCWPHFENLCCSRETPEDLARAATVVDEEGRLSKDRRRSGRAPGILKKWKIYHILYSEERTAEAVQEGFFGELNGVQPSSP